MTRTIPAAVDSPADPIAAAAASGAAIRTGILWMLASTCLFGCQDSTARILLKAYPATEIAFARFFVHMVLVGVFIAWRDPRHMISRRPLLQMLRSSFLLGATLFGMFALKVMPLVDFSAIVWVTPVLVAALSVVILHEKVRPSVWASVFAGLMGVWVIIGWTGMGFSVSMLFSFLLAAAILWFRWGLTAVRSHFCLIRAFAAATANIVAPFGYTALLWAILFGLLIFAEIPGPRTLFGAGLIAGAGLFIFLHGPKT